MRTLLVALATALVTAVVLSVSYGFGAFSDTPGEGLEAVTSESQLLNPRFLPAAGSEKIEHVPIVVGGQEWSITTFTNQLGELCAEEAVPGEGTAVTCHDPGNLRLGRGLRIFVGSRQQSPAKDARRWENIWIWGFAAPDVSEIEVNLTDCTTASLPVDPSGIFLYVAGPSTLDRDVWPHRLRAHTSTGKMVAEETVLDKIDVPDTQQAEEAQMKEPPPTACG